jgi:hypothetical protein
VVRLEKPRYVLAVVKDKPQNAQDWEKEGVKFATPGELSTTELDYDFLYVSKEAKDDFDKQRNHLRGLPQRPAVVADLAIDTNINPLDFVCTVYDAYLKALADSEKQDSTPLKGSDGGHGEFGQEAPYALYLYFEDPSKAEAWRQWWRDYTEKHRVAYMRLEAPDDNPIDEMAQEDGTKKIAILRHVRVGAYSGSGITRSTRAGHVVYQQYASYADPFFSFLFSVQPETLGPLVIRQIVESAIINVLIIDERIAQAAVSQRVADAGGPISLYEALYWMGIYVAGSVLVRGRPPFKYVGDEYLEDGKSRLQKVDIQNLINGKPYEIEKGFTVDLILIHATKLKEIADAMGISSEDLVEGLKKVNNGRRYVIVHSGRGKTIGDIPKSAPFLEYSIVQRHIVQEPSKFFIVQLALSAKENGK